MTAWVEVDLGPGVRAAFTTVEAGNLSLVVGDPAAATRARERLSATLGAPIAWPVQVHGSTVHLAEAPGDAVGEADAVVTGEGLGLAVLVADCVPVLLATPGGALVGAIHAGRRGVVAGVVGAAVDAMAERGAVREELRAVVGPAICGRCYEVPPELAAEVEASVPGSRSRTSWGTDSLDLPRAVIGQLRAAGVRDVVDLDLCSRTDTRFFSHRAHLAGVRPVGRIAGVVRRVAGVSAGPGGPPGLA